MPQRQQITYTGGPHKWEPDKYGNIAFDYNRVGTGETGARWGDAAHYQAVDPNVSLENYALRLAPQYGGKSYMVQNITNPDTYYNLDLSLQEQPRFIRNIIANSQYYNDINPETLNNVLDNAMVQEVIDKYSNQFYNDYKNMGSYGRNYINNVDEAKQVLSDVFYGTNYNPESYRFRGLGNHYLNKVGEDYLNKAIEYYKSKGIDPTKVDFDEFNIKQKGLMLEKILKENKGEVPQNLFKDRELDRIINKANNFIPLRPDEADYLGDIVAKGGGSGISPTGMQDDKIYVSKSGKYTYSLPVDSSLAEEVAESMVTGKGRDPFWNMQKENLRISPIQQTYKSESLEDIKQKVKQRYNNLSKAYATQRQINDLLYNRPKSVLEPTFKPSPEALSNLSKSINTPKTQPKITAKSVAKGIGKALVAPENIALAGAIGYLEGQPAQTPGVIPNPKNMEDLARSINNDTKSQIFQARMGRVPTKSELNNNALIGGLVSEYLYKKLGAKKYQEYINQMNRY